MIDFEKVEIHRMVDKASPTYLSWQDKLRTWWKLRDKKIKSGKNITFKKDVDISICETGSLEIGDNAFFHERCWILLTMPKPRIKIGKWVFFGRNTVLASKNSVEIGDYSLFAANCYIIDHEHGFSPDNVILNQKSVMQNVKIGRDCYFGTGTIILGGVTVGDGAIVAANSVVFKDIPPYEIWGGNPARFMKKRE